MSPPPGNRPVSFSPPSPKEMCWECQVRLIWTFFSLCPTCTFWEEVIHPPATRSAIVHEVILLTSVGKALLGARGPQRWEEGGSVSSQECHPGKERRQLPSALA